MINGWAWSDGVSAVWAVAQCSASPRNLAPDVIGWLHRQTAGSVTPTDLTLTVIQRLRKLGVVDKFVEFFGPGLDSLTLADRAMISNMTPECGATVLYFPVDVQTLAYMRLTGRPDELVELVEAYTKAQGLWRDSDQPEPSFTQVMEINLSEIVPSLAGPKRPQDRVALTDVKAKFKHALITPRAENGFGISPEEIGRTETVQINGNTAEIGHGSVVIAAITSCTNTSNPFVMLSAGLVAKKAVEKGLKTKPYVKTSLAPGSRVVTDYLEKARLMEPLAKLGFDLVGYGCTTCIGNSGPLAPAISAAINENDLVAAAVLSGNRNFEGRVNPDVRANYLASPPLVVAYALAGSLEVNLTTEPLGTSRDGKPVYLKDLWPTNKEIAELVRAHVTPDMFRQRYSDVFKGDEHWQGIAVEGGQTYAWNSASTYVQNPPYFEGLKMEPEPVTDIKDARVLGLFLDSITTDHISPAGSFKPNSPAGKYLTERQVAVRDFNSYGARRGNHEVMMRGTFANIRIKNQMVPGVEGGFTKGPNGEELPIYDAAMAFQKSGTPLVIFAGKEYGTGSSRDWAAKGTRLLGVRAVIAQSFERIHRSNLIGMGVLPLQLADGQSWQSLGLDGTETVSIEGLTGLAPRATVNVAIVHRDGRREVIQTRCRIDTVNELDYYRHGGILHYVLRHLVAA